MVVAAGPAQQCRGMRNGGCISSAPQRWPQNRRPPARIAMRLPRHKDRWA